MISCPHVERTPVKTAYWISKHNVFQEGFAGYTLEQLRDARKMTGWACRSSGVPKAYRGRSDDSDYTDWYSMEEMV